MIRGQRIRHDRILTFAFIFFVAEFVISTDPTLKNCMEEPQEVTDGSYRTALAYFQKCLDLGKNTSREALPTSYFNKVVENMRQSFEDFLEDSGLGEEQLAGIRKEIRELSGEIHHLPRKKASKPSSKDASHHNETSRTGAPNKISNKAKSNMLGNFTAAVDQPDNTLHLEVVNNIWPHQLYNVFPPDEDQSAPAAESFVHQQLLNSTNSSVHNPLKKCGSNKNANGVEVLTLFLCIFTLAVCSWMAYKIYCQYQLWSRVRYEASNHKTETTPLNQSDSCLSSKNVCNDEKNPSGSTGSKKRGFLP